MYCSGSGLNYSFKENHSNLRSTKDKNKKRKFQEIENYIEKSPGLGSMTDQDCDGGTVNELFYINIESKPEMRSPKETKKSKHTIV